MHLQSLQQQTKKNNLTLGEAVIFIFEWFVIFFLNPSFYPLLTFLWNVYEAPISWYDHNCP